MSVTLEQKHYSLLDGYFAQQALLNGVKDESVKGGRVYSISPEVEQNWVNKLTEVDPFLKTIDMGFCTSQIVNDLGVDDAGLISGRTKTSGTGAKDREPTSLSGVNGFEYIARETTHDTYLTYSDIDAWAREPAKFQLQITEKRANSKASDVLRIGWNGKIAAETTDKVANPLGQDVNIGWLERIRVNAPEQVVDGTVGSKVAGKIVISDSAAGDFKNIDSLVNDIMTNTIPKQFHRNLKVFVSNDLLGDRTKKLIEKSTVTEIGNVIVQTAQYIINGLPAESPDFFPEGTILITSSKNLMHRIQKQSMRTSFSENPKRSRYENFNSANEFYAIGNYQAAALAENIKIEV